MHVPSGPLSMQITIARNSFMSILSLVAANLGVSMVPESSQQLQIQGVVYRPFASPAPTVGLAVIYKQHLATQLAINFASMLQMVCHQGAT